MRLFNILKAFTLLDLKQSYFRKFYVVMEGFSIALTLVIYYYSAKAFTPTQYGDLNFYGADLFSYLFWGDLLLRFPQSFFYSPVNNLKTAFQENTFEPMVIQARSVRLILLGLSTMQAFRELVSVIIIVALAALFLDLQVPLPTMLKVGLMTFLFIPFFLGIGYFIMALVLLIQKGESIIYLISNLLAILAGMYFPVEVFPETIQRIGSWVSPYSYFLQSGRQLLQTGVLDYEALGLFFIGGLIICGLGLETVLWIYNKRKLSGELSVIY